MFIAKHIIHTAVIMLAVSGMAISVLADGKISGEPFAWSAFGNCLALIFMLMIDVKKDKARLQQLPVYGASVLVGAVTMLLAIPHIVELVEAFGKYNYVVTCFSAFVISMAFGKHIDAAEERGAQAV